ncbi:unnamed protein product, partial [Mesorhabditis spiculigera]
MSPIKAQPLKPKLDLPHQNGSGGGFKNDTTMQLTPEPIRRCRSPSPVVQHTGFMDQLSVKPLRRTRSARSASPAVHRSVHITADHGVLIKKTWQRVPKNQFGETLIQDLANRIGRESFGPDPTSYERHARHFVDLIQSAVDNLADLEEALKPWLTVLGRGHVGFRIKSKHWDSFGESVLATVSIYIGPGRQHKETVKAWMLLSSFLADRLGAACRSTNLSPMVTPRLQLMTFVQP